METSGRAVPNSGNWVGGSQTPFGGCPSPRPGPMVLTLLPLAIGDHAHHSCAQLPPWDHHHDNHQRSTWMMFMKFQEATGGGTPSCDPLATSGNLLGRGALPEVPTGTQWGPLAELFFLVELAFILSPLPRFILSPTLFYFIRHSSPGAQSPAPGDCAPS